jgi:hypothetical protein
LLRFPSLGVNCARPFPTGHKYHRLGAGTCVAAPVNSVIDRGSARTTYIATIPFENSAGSSRLLKKPFGEV